ncbi:hypothetical protein ACFX16_013743 [Malus domestica]
MWVMTFSRSSARFRFTAISFLLCSKVASIVLMLNMMTLLMLNMMTLGGMISFEPNSNKKGVSPVTHRLVMRYAHKTLGSSSGHFPYLSVRDFLRQSGIVLLGASAYLLPWGYLSVNMGCLMPYLWKNFAKSLPTNYGALSMTIY